MAYITNYITGSKLDKISLKKLDEVFDCTYQFEINYQIWKAIGRDMYLDDEFLQKCIEKNIKNKEAVELYTQSIKKH